MPFPGGIEAAPNGTLVLSLLAAIFYLMALRRPPSLRRTAVKAAAVALLAVLAAMQAAPVLLIAGLALGALGDALLADDGERRFLAGLLAFLAAHLAYVALFLGHGEGLGPLTAQPWRAALVIAGGAGCALLLRRLVPAVGFAMRGPVLVYAAAIFAMLAAAATVATPLVVGGAALFVLSDAILAIERFLLAGTSPHRTWTGPAVWVLYYAAQVTIALAFML